MSSVKKNFMYQSVYQIVIILLPLVTSPYVARVLGAERIGIYSYTYAIAHYFSLFALMGVANHGNRSIASVRDNGFELKKTFSELLVIHCIIAGIAVLLYYVFFFVFIKEDRLCAAIQGLLVVGSFFDISWFFFGLEKFKFTVMRSTLVKIIMTGLVFIFVNSKDDVWIYCLIMAGGILLSQLVLWPFALKYIDFTCVTKSGIFSHIKPLLILFIPAIAVSIYKYMDKIMLGIMTTKMQVGYYENAERAINIPISIIASFGTVMLPKMSNLASKKERAITEKYIGFSMEFVMCMTMAMVLGMISISEDFSIVFWGKDFSSCGIIIQVLSISIVFVSFANVLRTQYLIPQKMDKVYIYSVFVGALSNMIINYLLIGRMGAIGAAIGTVIAELSVCLIQSFSVSNLLPIMAYIKNSIPFVIIGGVMFATISLLDLVDNILIRLALKIIIGAVSFSVLSVIYFVKSKNEYILKMLNNSIKKYSAILDR